MKPHLLFFAVEAIGLFAVVLLGSRLIVSAPARRNVQLAALICLDAACARLLARQARRGELRSTRRIRCTPP